MRIKWDNAGNLLSTALATQKMLVINGMMFIINIQGQHQNYSRKRYRRERERKRDPDLSIIVTAYKIKKEVVFKELSCRKMLLFMVEQVFLPMGEVWYMHNADTQHTVWGERRPKGREKILCLNFFLSCHKT